MQRARVNGDTRLRLAATLAAAVLTLGACTVEEGTNEGTSEPPTTSATSAVGSEADSTPQTEVQVEMTDALRFRPPDVVLKVGGKVTWTNPSTVVHSHR